MSDELYFAVGGVLGLIWLAYYTYDLNKRDKEELNKVPSGDIMLSYFGGFLGCVIFGPTILMLAIPIIIFYWLPAKYFDHIRGIK